MSGILINSVINCTVRVNYTHAWGQYIGHTPTCQFNLQKNFREDVKDESYPEFCADQLLYYPFH